MAKFIFALLVSAMVSTLMVKGDEVENCPVAEVKNPAYKVETKKFKTPLLKECGLEIVISGNGICGDYGVPCDVHGLNIVATETVLLVKNRDKKNPLILFSNTPSVLIYIGYDEKCSRITFTTGVDSTTSTKIAMSAEDCESTKRIIALAETTNIFKEARRKSTLIFQKMFPPEFFEALKTDKLVDFDSSSGWSSWDG